MSGYDAVVSEVRRGYDESGDWYVGVISIKPFVMSEHPGYDYGEEESRVLLVPTHVMLVSIVGCDNDTAGINVCENWIAIDDGGELHWCIDEWYADPADYEDCDEEQAERIIQDFKGEVIYRY